ncbi:MAG: ATP-binding cassette domain-containing protein [Lachnospiraceae bacterium]|nr:ATP-binding cassette domain-containing protein [Lachnospiraceae bacterium]
MKLEIRNLTKTYGQIQALKGVTFTLENGIYGLLGPNGAGKSTLIHLLTDNIKREKGTILWNGTEILNLGKEYRKLLGYMPQQQGYYEDFSAEAFLMYMAQLKGIHKKTAKETVQQMLSVVNLSEVAKERIGSFSGGMKQRLLLAQALLNDPKILILDEPTAGVDPQERIRIRNFISEIATDRIVILATHIVSDVESIAKEIILLKKGDIIEQGTPYELLEMIKSYVYEIYISEEQLKEIQNKYIISNLRHTSKGLAVKILTKYPPKEYEYQNGIANLEDVYLYYFENE